MAAVSQCSLIRIIQCFLSVAAAIVWMFVAPVRLLLQHLQCVPATVMEKPNTNSPCLCTCVCAHLHFEVCERSSVASNLLVVITRDESKR